MGAGYVEKGPGRTPSRWSVLRPARDVPDYEVVCITHEVVDGRRTRIKQIGIRRDEWVELMNDLDVAAEVALGARFHVGQGADTAYLRVNRTEEGRYFVETRADATMLNNLDSLGECSPLPRTRPFHRERAMRLPAWAWLIPILLLAVTAIVVIRNMTPITLSWPAPADVRALTTLGDAQLNATANRAGTYVYQPLMGTLLHAGQHQPIHLAFSSAPLPSPWREIAIVLGILTLITAVVLFALAWTGRGRREGYEIVQRQGTAPTKAAKQNKTAEQRRQHGYEEGHYEERHYEERHEERREWRPSLALLIVVLGLGALLWYYLAYPRTVLAEQFINVTKLDPSITWAKPERITYPTKLSSVQLNAVGSVPGRLEFVPPVDTLLNAGAGQMLTVKLTPDSSDYNQKSATVNLDVAKGTPVITWKNAFDLIYGVLLGPDQFSATVTQPGALPGDLAYSLGSTIKLTDLLKVGTYDLAVTYHPKDSQNWNDASATAKIRIGPVPVKLTWPNPAAITYPTPLSDATFSTVKVDPNVGGKRVPNPDPPTVLEVGDHQLTVAFQPADSTDYGPATITATQRVLPGPTSIDWVNPAGITIGTALGPEQLNAKGSVPGELKYEPGTGTVLPAGDAQVLKVTLTPADKNYASSTKTVTLTVKYKNQPPDNGQPHNAQFFKNPDFEGGFTVKAPATAIGTHWDNFNSGDYHYGYYDDQWSAVWYNANHSQLIEIGSSGYDPGDRPDRLSGISQTVRGLIPGKTYTLTLHGIIRVTEGDPNTDNHSYIAEWGMATGKAGWTDVRVWRQVPWNHVYPYLSAGPVQSYTTTFTAPSDTVTIFMGLLKRPGKGNTELNLNFDGLSLVGPTYDASLTMQSR